MRTYLALLLCMLCLPLGACQQDVAQPSADASDAVPAVASLAESLEAAELEPLRLRLVAVGDNLIHYPIYQQAWQPDLQRYDFRPSYAAVRELIYGADIAFLNQEIPTAGEEYGISSYPLFNSPTELVGDMADYLGVDVVNMASNHSIDKGVGGMAVSIELWQEHGVIPLGVWHESSQPDGVLLSAEEIDQDKLLGGFADRVGQYGNIKFMKLQDLRIAFVGYTYGLNGLVLDESQGWHIAMLDDWQLMEENIRLAQQVADLVIVSLHWGYEGALWPNEMQEELARKLAALNVDLIIGHHPHVIQPVEVLQRADGKAMPVFYSLGNFISNQIEAENMLGILATVEIVRDEQGLRLENPAALPLVTHFTPGFYETYVYPLADYAQEQSWQHGICSYDSRFSSEWIRQLAEQVIAPEYLIWELS